MIGDIIERVVRYEWLLEQEEEFMREAYKDKDWNSVNKSAAMIRELEEKVSVAVKRIDELARLN